MYTFYIYSIYMFLLFIYTAELYALDTIYACAF